MRSLVVAAALSAVVVSFFAPSVQATDCSFVPNNTQLYTVTPCTVAVGDPLLAGDKAVAVAAPSASGSYILLRNGAAESVHLRREPNSDDFSIYTANSEKLRLTGGGRLGLGTTAPSAKLQLNGSTAQQHLLLTNPSGGTISGMVWGADSLTIAFDADVIPGASVWTGRSTSSIYLAKSSGLFHIMGSTQTANTTATPADLLTINPTNGATNISGNLTVGPAGGNVTVTINGTLQGTNIKANYQDVAEWVPSSGDVTPGTVVVLAADVANHVVPSHDAYDTRVAGVVSAQPGLILGKEGKDMSQVATTGRVKVKVDASQHAIAIGDLLVTSDKPGYAMYSEPMTINGRKFHQPGTVLGKALEPLASGSGEILVLLSLQ